MGVYINGMKMPGNCGECAFCRAAIWKGKEYPCVCLARNIVVKPSETDMRDGLCPLIEVHDHGDLIDRDEIFMQLRMDFAVIERMESEARAAAKDYLDGERMGMGKAMIRVYEHEPVIPAERSEDDSV